jgi:enediyne polyketide synthase
MDLIPLLLWVWLAGIPEQKTLLDLWENVLARRIQFRKTLDCRFPMDSYYSLDKNAPDKTYGNKSSYIEDFEFDWATNRFPKSAYDSTDPVHWLALDVATKALNDAGFDRKTVPLVRSGVIVGNSLAGESSRSNSLRVRWPLF